MVNIPKVASLLLEIKKSNKKYMIMIEILGYCYIPKIYKLHDISWFVVAVYLNI